MRFSGFNLLVFIGLMHLRPEHGAITTILMTILTPLLSWLLRGQQREPFTVFTMVISFTGVFLVITEGNVHHAFSNGSAEWDLLFLLGMRCWVGYAMGVQLFATWSALRYTALTCCLDDLTITVITIFLSYIGMLHRPSLSNVIILHWSLFY